MSSTATETTPDVTTERFRQIDHLLKSKVRVSAVSAGLRSAIAIPSQSTRIRCLVRWYVPMAQPSRSAVPRVRAAARPPAKLSASQGSTRHGRVKAVISGRMSGPPSLAARARVRRCGV